MTDWYGYPSYCTLNETCVNGILTLTPSLLIATWVAISPPCDLAKMPADLLIYQRKKTKKIQITSTLLLL